MRTACYWGCTLLFLRADAVTPRSGPDQLARSPRPSKHDSYPGTLIPIRVGSLKANTTGRIVKVHVRTGDQVRAGDLLCEMDDRIYSAALERARAKLRLAESRYRAGAAAANAAGDLDEVKIKLRIAKADADAAGAECASAEHRLTDTKIRAPFERNDHGGSHREGREG